MRIIVPIAKTALAVLIIGCTMYYEQFYVCTGIFASYSLALIGFVLSWIFSDLIERRGGYWIFIGLCLFFTTWIHLLIGLRAIHDNNKISVVTAFYPLGKSLGNGYMIDTLKHVARCYRHDTNYSIYYDDMYVLKGDTHHTLFSSHLKIAQGTNFEFHEKDFGHGKLHICSYIDNAGVKHIIDMYGKDILDSLYSPTVIDTSTDYIDYNSSMY